MRIAESLSKMKLQPFATEADIEEALRLFQVSTLDAAMSGSLSGEADQECVQPPFSHRSFCGEVFWENKQMPPLQCGAAWEERGEA